MMVWSRILCGYAAPTHPSFKFPLLSGVVDGQQQGGKPASLSCCRKRSLHVD